MAEKNVDEVAQEIKQHFDKTTETLKADYEEKVKNVAESQKSELQKEFTEKMNELEAKYGELEKNLRDRNTKIGMEEKDRKDFSFARAYAGIISGDFDKVGAGYEKEIMEAATQKKIQAGDGTAGGYAIADELQSEIIDMPVANLPLTKLGMKVYRGLTGNVTFPKLITRQDASHVAENGTPPELKYEFGQVQMTPKRVSGFTKISNQALIQNSVAMEQFIRAQLKRSLAQGVHEGAINGDGSQNQPSGIVGGNYNFTSTDAIGTNGGRFTIRFAQQMATDLEEADINMDEGSFGYLTRSIVLEGMKLQRVDGTASSATGEFVYSPPVISDTKLEDLLGYKIGKTSKLSKTLTKGTSSSCTSVVFGDWSQFAMGLWSGPTLRVSREASNGSDSAFLSDEMWLIVDQYYDTNVLLDTAFTKISDAETTRSNW